MADITMCKGENCIIKNKCKRYTAKSSEHQSYFSPIKQDGTCDEFLHNGRSVFDIAVTSGELLEN